ncbi:MAG: LPS assembly lipoprotein LptE [Gammaproteobacteria bacterium]|nr:LPS assembly lipoprotein LptE [Gammaproteobacteria bacterium]
MLHRVTVLPADYFRLLILIAAVLLNSGCGFQLRGSLDLSDSISPLYIEQDSAFELAREITGMVVKNNIVLADDAAKAKSQLTLVNENRSRRVLSVDGNGRAREYLLTYTVNIKIRIQQAKEIPDSVSISRSLLFDPDAVLAVTNEAEILYRDMRKDAARLVLLKLQALSNSQLPAGQNRSVEGSSSVQEAGPVSSNGNVQ